LGKDPKVIGPNGRGPAGISPAHHWVLNPGPFIKSRVPEGAIPVEPSPQGPIHSIFE